MGSFFGVCYYAGLLRLSEQDELALLDGIELVLPKTVDIAGQAVPTSEGVDGSEKTMDNTLNKSESITNANEDASESITNANEDTSIAPSADGALGKLKFLKLRGVNELS